jgi:SAM-dependent methyltransferase
MNKKLKLYLNENGLRFNLNEQRIWKYVEEIFGENRARELSDIFEETYIEKGKAKDVNRKYQFCKSFEEATTLMYFQSDWFFKNSIIIIEDILKNKPKSVLELGCYTGVFANYLSTIENIPTTGIDLEENLISFGKERYKNNKLKLVNLDYKNLDKLNKKFDYIFTNFGLENIPNPKFDDYKIRENQNYISRLKYFDEFFTYLNAVSSNETEFLCIARIPTIECILAIVDASHKNGWTWLSSDFKYIEHNNEVIPQLKFIKKQTKPIDISLFINELLKFKNEENNELFQINLFEKEKPNLILLNKDSYKYEQTNDELFYEIYKSDNLYALLAWTTLGYFKYKKFDNKEKLINLFKEEFGLMIDPDRIND